MNKTYKVSDIETILQLSRTKAYALVNQDLFPVIRIGKILRIPVEPFDKWMISQINQGRELHKNDDKNDKTKAM